jgi:hypothetical protein
MNINQDKFVTIRIFCKGVLLHVSIFRRSSTGILTTIVMLIFTAVSSHICSSVSYLFTVTAHNIYDRRTNLPQSSPFFAGRHQAQPQYSIFMFLQSVSSRCHKFSPQHLFVFLSHRFSVVCLCKLLSVCFYCAG